MKQLSELLTDDELCELRLILGDRIFTSIESDVEDLVECCRLWRGAKSIGNTKYKYVISSTMQTLKNYMYGVIDTLAVYGNMPDSTILLDLLDSLKEDYFQFLQEEDLDDLW